MRRLADELAWDIAADLRTIVPVWDLASTIRHAILDDWASQCDLDDADPAFFVISLPIRKMVNWFIDHEPEAAGHLIGETIGEACRRLGFSREVCERSWRMELSADGPRGASRRERSRKGRGRARAQGPRPATRPPSTKLDALEEGSQVPPAVRRPGHPFNARIRCSSE